MSTDDDGSTFVTRPRNRPFALVYDDQRVQGMTLKAWGLFCFLMGQKPGWEMRVHHVASEFKDGRDAVEGARNELVSLGLLIKEAYLEGGLRRWRYILDPDVDPRSRRSAPETGNPVLEDEGQTRRSAPETGFPAPGNPAPGKPAPGKPAPGNPQQTSKRLRSTDLRSTNSGGAPAARPPAPRDADPSTSGRSSTGTRLPEDWTPSPELIAKAARDAPDIDQETEFRNFQRHWLSATGKGATKRRWDLTYEKWMAEEQKRANDRAKRSTPAARPSPAAERLANGAALAARLRAERLAAQAPQPQLPDLAEGLF